MHDIDRTQLEMGWETDEYGYEYEGEEEMEGEYEFYEETANEMASEMADEAAMTHGLFTEMDEMELAAELLEVTDEAELEQFLGDLMHKAARAAGGILRTPQGKALGGVLKGIARQAIPMAGAGLGRLAPALNGAGGKLLSDSASHLFGLEMEGMSAEDQEFEAARRFVHLAGDAVQNVLQAAPKMPLANAVQKAVATAAHHHAPGLLRLAASAAQPPVREGGWRPRHKLIEAAKAEYAHKQAVANPFSEAEEMELATELLEITDEAELDQFLGKLLKKVSGGLKGLAKKALPFVSSALGSAIPIPGVGSALGSAAGSALSKALETEFAGLNEEDQEFETARRVVRVVGSAAQQIAQAQPDADPQKVVRNALLTAAQQHIPGLANGNNPGQGSGVSQSGRWERRGRTIVLFDL